MAAYVQPSCREFGFLQAFAVLANLAEINGPGWQSVLCRVCKSIGYPAWMYASRSYGIGLIKLRQGASSISLGLLPDRSAPNHPRKYSSTRESYDSCRPAAAKRLANHSFNARQHSYGTQIVTQLLTSTRPGQFRHLSVNSRRGLGLKLCHFWTRAHERDFEIVSQGNVVLFHEPENFILSQLPGDTKLPQAALFLGPSCG